jgi:ferredoxin
MVYFGNGEEPAMKVTVDHDLCEANGVCAGLAPEVFDLDDEDRLHILLPEVPPRLAELARRAVGSCPKTALRLKE